ncbi:lipopolysaccharide biosynthesis protein [Vibrio cyclitrophicus]|uniref:lipopolysaccharide biosynthesis protein n=1 Tax=Vibrio cyclitrophicus TaxID=47951 RepID=UPI0038B4439F
MSKFIASLGKGAKWTVIDKVLNQFFKVVVLIFMARLLTPEEFGFITIATFFILIAESFVNSGFTHAYINSRVGKEQGFTNLVILNIITSILFCVIIICFSVFIEEYYEIEGLSDLLCVFSPIIIIDSLYSCYRALAEKELKFKSITIVVLPSYVAGAIVGIACAYNGLSYWSIVIQHFVYKSLLLILTYNTLGKNSINYNSINTRIIKDYINYGWKLQISALINVFSKELNSFVIGTSVGVSQAGLYARVNNLQALIVQTVVMVVERVSFPLLSSNKDRPEELVENTRTTNILFAMVLYPILCSLYINSEDVIFVLFGSEWVHASSMLEILLFAGFVRFMQSSNLTYLKVISRTDVVLKLRIAEAIISVTAISIGYNWGLKGLVISVVIASYISYVIIALVSSRLSSYRLISQIKDVILLFIASIISASIVEILMQGIFYDSFIFILGGIVIKTSFLFLCYMAIVRFTLWPVVFSKLR